MTFNLNPELVFFSKEFEYIKCHEQLNLNWNDFTCSNTIHYKILKTLNDNIKPTYLPLNWFMQ